MNILSASARSFLFVPADRPDRFDKAAGSGADVVILDLEDAIAVDRKEQARANAAAWLTSQKLAWVRINPRNTEWHERDLRLLQLSGVLGIVVPKAEVLDESLIQHCTRFGKSIIPLVETAEGFQNASALARVPAVVRLAFGHLDFQVDLGIAGDDDALLFFRSQLVLMSRLANLAPPIDGVTVDLKDAAQLTSDAQRARRYGFGGKLCIHPSQIDAVNRAFVPSADELSWANSILDGPVATLGGVVARNGVMVDRPVVLKAQRIVAIAALWQR